MSNQPTLDTLTALAKRRGFVYTTSEIYGGLASSYDYGPLGAELLRNIRNAWWNTFISRRADIVGLDSQILLHPQTWVASGHKVAVFPLLKNGQPLAEKARSVYEQLAPHLAAAWDERGNIGKRYYYQDEIGTPFCITIDFDTLEDDTVTVRERDTMEQVRVSADGLLAYLQRQINPKT